MKTNDLLLKFQSNNSKLETVLYKKKFSADVKNLLLSMLYNITNSYNDYSSIKVNVEDKNEFIKNIIEIIEKCTYIEIVKASSERGKEFINNNKVAEIDTYLKTIDVLPTEKAMLYALFKMNDTKMFLDEKYSVLRVALPEMLNEGRDINNIEIIRDFNAWSWNTLPQEISNIDCNLVYQNLQILLGFDFLENWMKLEKQKELLDKLVNELKKNYSEELINKFIDYIYRLSILICIARNPEEKKRLLEEKAWDESEIERLENKVKLVEDLTKTKKDKAKEIKKIDKILNDPELLKKEFDKRNKKLSEYKKIYSIENLEGTLKKERRKALNEIEECNNLLDAKKYVKLKEELENNLSLLKEVKTPKHKNTYKLKLQEIFLDCLKEKIEKTEESGEAKKQLIELLRIFRYYNFIVYDEKRFIKDVDELKEKLHDIEKMLLTKLYDMKAINQITKDMDTDINIMMQIFESRIMDLEKTVFDIKLNENNIDVKMYDGNVFELEYSIENTKEIKIKTKKKIKLFAK